MSWLSEFKDVLTGRDNSGGSAYDVYRSSGNSGGIFSSPAWDQSLQNMFMMLDRKMQQDRTQRLADEATTKKLSLLEGMQPEAGKYIKQGGYREAVLSGLPESLARIFMQTTNKGVLGERIGALMAPPAVKETALTDVAEEPLNIDFGMRMDMLPGFGAARKETVLDKFTPRNQMERDAIIKRERASAKEERAITKADKPRVKAQWEQEYTAWSGKPENKGKSVLEFALWRKGAMAKIGVEDKPLFTKTQAMKALITIKKGRRALKAGDPEALVYLQQLKDLNPDLAAKYEEIMSSTGESVAELTKLYDDYEAHIRANTKGLPVKTPRKKPAVAMPFKKAPVESVADDKPPWYKQLMDSIIDFEGKGRMGGAAIMRGEKPTKEFDQGNYKFGRNPLEARKKFPTPQSVKTALLSGEIESREEAEYLLKLLFGMRN